MTSTLKPLDIGRKLLTEAEFSELLAGYQPSKLSSEGNPILMFARKNYTQGIYALQEKCQVEDNRNHPQHITLNGSMIYRPLTFKENLQLKIEDYETLRDNQGNVRSLIDRERFFHAWLGSCCGVAYKTGTTKFKLIPVCEELITINKNFNSKYLSIDYDSLQGVELNSEKVKCGQVLTKCEVLEHPVWLAAVEGDKDLLKTYADLVFSKATIPTYVRSNVLKAMAFRVLNPSGNDDLTALVVENISNSSSSATGDEPLNRGMYFCRLAP